MSEPLSIWTLYDHPFDCPDMFLLRRWVVVDGVERVCPEYFACAAIEPLRDKMRERGLICMPRSDGDEPKIVESWL